MNTKAKEGARNKGNPYFLRIPLNKGGLVNTGPGLPGIPLVKELNLCLFVCVIQRLWDQLPAEPVNTFSLYST